MKITNPVYHYEFNKGLELCMCGTHPIGPKEYLRAGTGFVEFEICCDECGISVSDETLEGVVSKWNSRPSEEKLKNELGVIGDDLYRIIKLIESAGLHNLSNGVQLGQISWTVKMKDALDSAKSNIKEIFGTEI